MLIHLIVAMAENRVIGRDGQLPWHLSADLKRFRRLTTGHPIIMGRRTYESIGRPLPDRRNIVLSRNADFAPVGVERASSLEDALARCHGEPDVFIIGGADLYGQALPRVDRIHLTLIREPYEGDAWFPELPEGMFVETEREEHAEPIPHAFVTLNRASGAREGHGH